MSTVVRDGTLTIDNRMDGTLTIDARIDGELTVMTMLRQRHAIITSNGDRIVTSNNDSIVDYSYDL